MPTPYSDPVIAVYPRWRGEFQSESRTHKKGRGLSPLARGTRVKEEGWAVNTRFIPAGAGNSSFSLLARPARAVYPRWRGELWIASPLRASSTGLSPLARGTLTRMDTSVSPRRFIPAGAGNSPRIDLLSYWLPVYPRWRGELLRFLHHSKLKLGLSPLARGTRYMAVFCVTRCRFIPAGAGNSPGCNTAQTGPPVYPRWRGELPRGAPYSPAWRGLSPLARGTRRASSSPAWMIRFIPAGAGNSCRLFLLMA